MNIEKITWQETLPIRHRVLWPEKPPSFCQVPDDENADHYGVFINGLLVSVASVYIDGKSARLRKFATLPEHQGKGIGSRLLQHILDQLHKQDVEHFWCDARAGATAFYQRFGMRTEGERFQKSGVDYFKMSVDLT